MKADRVNFEEPLDSEEETRKVGKRFQFDNLIEKEQIFATVP